MSQGEGGGRPTKYRSAYIEQVKIIARLGATEFEIAQALGVAHSTLRRWCTQHPKLLAAIKVGKGPPNRRTEMSLYARANGYTYEAEEIFLIDVTKEIPGETPEAPKTIVRTKEVLRVPVVKHLPPDTGAIAFWLKNREKGKWRDRQDHEISGKGGKPIAFEVASETDLLGAYYARLAKIAAEQDPDSEPLSPEVQPGDGLEDPAVIPSPSNGKRDFL